MGISRVIALVAGLVGVVSAAQGEIAATQPAVASPLFKSPALLSLDAPESVYAPPEPPRADEGVNEGGVNFDLRVAYMTDYVYRGIEQFEVPAAEDRANAQVSGELDFDLGKFPHPFIGVFTNVAEQDPIEQFQEIRPYFGLELTIAPFTFRGGNNTYIHPDRSSFDTSEVFGQITLNDSTLWHTGKPVLSPYIYGAYDYDLYAGWYLEAGVSHTFEIADTGISLIAYGNAAYVHGVELYSLEPGKDDGFQHYQIGLEGHYSLNSLFNVPKRYGEWTLIGFLNYTDGLTHELRADTQLWGGAAIEFRY